MPRGSSLAKNTWIINKASHTSMYDPAGSTPQNALLGGRMNQRLEPTKSAFRAPSWPQIKTNSSQSRTGEVMRLLKWCSQKSSKSKCLGWSSGFLNFQKIIPLRRKKGKTDRDGGRRLLPHSVLGGRRPHRPFFVSEEWSFENSKSQASLKTHEL